MKKITDKDYFYIIILLFIAIFSFWQITFSHNCLKWDYMDISFPWRYYVGECLQNSELPLWSPFSRLGIPLHIDPQSWYPVSWLIGFSFGYNIFTLQLEFVFHIFMAGMGMYFLTKHFISEKKIRFFSAVIFMLSGFFVSNAQHCGWIVSGAWIPFILYAYLNIYKKKNIASVLELVLFFFMLITGGYIAFFIIISYTILGIFIYKIITVLIKKDYSFFKKIIKLHLFFLISFTLLSAVVLISLIEAKEILHRGDGLTLARSLNNSISPEALITFLFPFSTMSKNIDFWKADVTVINSYFSFFAIFLILVGFSFKMKKKEIVFLALGILAYLIAMGEAFPLRKMLYHTLPLMDLFRFPSLFRYFGILSFSIYAGLILNKIIKNKDLFYKTKYSFVAFYVLYLSFVLIFVRKISNVGLRINNWTDYIKTISFSETIVIQGIIGVLLLSILLSMFLFYKKKMLFTIILVVIMDMFLATQLNAPKTIFSKASPIELQSKLNKLPSGFPIPDNTKKIIDINEKGKYIYPLWRNLNFFYKETAYTATGPYALNSLDIFEKSGLYETLLHNPLLYFAENIIMNKGLLDTVFIKKNKKGIAINPNLEGSDTTESSIIITKFSPNYIELETETKNNRLLIFMQNNSSGWHAYVDDKETEIMSANYSLMSIKIPAGEHLVRFEYKPKKIIYSFYISAISFIGLVIFLLLFRIKKLKFIVIISSLFLGIYTIVFLNFKIYSNNNSIIKTEIICNAEKLTDDKKYFLLEENDEIKLNNTNIQTDENSYSGNYSIKLSKIKQFGFTHKLNNIKKGDRFVVSVWRLGEDGVIVFQEDVKGGIYSNSAKIITTDNKWTQIEHEFIATKDFTNTVKIYIWYSANDSAYFDDYKITSYKKK